MQWPAAAGITVPLVINVLEQVAGFLQARCPSCLRINSVKAMRGKNPINYKRLSNMDRLTDPEASVHIRVV